MASIALRRFVRGSSVLLALLFFSAPPSIAETYSFDFEGDLEIWDLSGTYDDYSLGINISYDMVQDAQGKITGYGEASGTSQGVYIETTFDITGSVTQKNGVGIVKLLIKFQGTAEYQGEVYRFTATEKVTAEIDPLAQTITGEVKVKVSMKGYGSYSDSADFEADLPPDMDGSAAFTFEVTADGKKLVGTGELVLSNGETYQFSVKGTFKAKTNVSSFKFTGIDSAKKSKLNMQVDEDDGHIIKLSGKILGQKLKEENIQP